MKYVATQRSGVKVFLLIAALLALCFALSGCYEVYTVADYNLGHVHTYEIGDNDGDMQIRCGVPVLYLYEQLPDAFTDGVDPYNENEIIDVKNNDIVAACGEIYPEYEMYHCTGCGTLIWRPNGQTRVLEHDWEEWEPFHEATCTEPQEDVRSCIRCGAEEYQSVGKPLGHDYESDDAVPATCTEDGRKANKKCKRCGHMHSGEVIPAPGHDLVQHGAQAATCTTVGWDAYVTCSRCNYTTYVEKAALGHDWGDATYTWSDDHGKCTARHECRRCKYYEDVTANAMAADIPATCTENAKTVYTATFGDPFATQTVTVTAEGTAAGHDWGDATYTWSADYDECTARRVCKRDSSHYEDVTANAMAADIPATCTEDAKTVYTATFGDPFATQTVTVTAEGTAAGHDWGDATYTWSADRGKCTASRVCKRDGNHVETETADVTLQTTGDTCTGGATTYSATFTNPAFVAQSDTVVFDGVGHSEEIIPGVPATCKKTGLSEGKICSVCGEILEAQQQTPLAAHIEQVVPAVPATCKKTGLSEGKKCSVCEEILVEQNETDIDPNNHEGPFVLGLNADVPSTCTTPGYHTEGICKACGVEVKTALPVDSDNHGKVVVLPAVPATCVSTGLTEGMKCAGCGKVLSGLTETPVDPDNHDWGEWMQTIAPTCTEPGTDTRFCMRAGCGAYEQRQVNALGHDWGEWTPTKAPNCKDPGEKTHTCQRTGCGATETELIPAVEGAHVAAEAVPENVVEGTCQTEGSYDSVVYCTKCNAEISREKVNTGKKHSNIVTVNASKAICGQDGYTGDKVCIDCDDTIEEGKVIPAPAAQHVYGEDGICKNCGEKQPEVVSGGNS